MKTRLFIGNLAETVTEKELQEKFEALLSSYPNEAQVGGVEVRCKNNTNFFGYVDVYIKNGVSEGDGKVPMFLRKCIDLMNNTKWKGSLIKVQIAKESFIEKLRREQQTRQNADGKANDGTATVLNKDDKNFERSMNQKQALDVLNKISKTKYRVNRKNEFDESLNQPDKNAECGFEIVGSDSIPKNSAPTKLPSPSKGKDGEKTSVLPRTTSPSRSREKHLSPSKRKKLAKRRRYSSSEDDSSDDEVKDGIPKFKGLMLSYPEGLPETQQNHEKSIEHTEVMPEKMEENETSEPIQQKLLNLAFESDHKQSRKPKDSKDHVAIPSSENRKATSTATNSQNPSSSAPVANVVINFRKNKQQKSDQLRMKSLEKQKDLQAQRRNLIKSSLSSVTATAPASEQRKVFSVEDDEDDGGGGNDQNEPLTKRAKPALTLFDDNEEEDEEENVEGDDVFKVKKQFEGAQGEKLLEMQTRWGNDDRFKIDDRFKESDDENEGEEPVEKEKEKQLNILTDLFGKDFKNVSKEPSKKSKTNSATSTSFNSVILPRYDPENDTVDSQKQGDNKIERKKKKEVVAQAKDTEETPKEAPIRSSEPVTYKTASNLKELFSSTSGNDGGETAKDKVVTKTKKTSVFDNSESKPQTFSLLSTFGGQVSDDEEDNDVQLSSNSKIKSPKDKSSSSSGPRSFWHSNPFRYDSSDDEDENKALNKSKQEKNIHTNESSVTITSIHKTPFFFAVNDARFEGLDDYFLKEDDFEGKIMGEKDEKGEKEEDYSVKRQELRAIIKAKIRNTKRKDEKRTLAIKRAIRKRKRKVQHMKRNQS